MLVLRNRKGKKVSCHPLDGIASERGEALSLFGKGGVLLPFPDLGAKKGGGPTDID